MLIPVYARARRRIIKKSSWAYFFSSWMRLNMIDDKIYYSKIRTRPGRFKRLLPFCHINILIFIWQFGIMPSCHIKIKIMTDWHNAILSYKIKNFSPLMPNWHTSPYRLTQSRILALIFVYCLQNWQFWDDCLHRA